MIDFKNRLKDSVDAFQNIKAISVIKKKKDQLEKALHSAKYIRQRDSFIFVY